MPVLLLENKVFRPAASPDEISLPMTATRPWKIGWFGALRCRRSLGLLADFTRRLDGQVEVILRGRPAYSEFDDFDRFVAHEPYLHFYGPYKNPEELAAIYGEVHFSWAIDFFEAGQRILTGYYQTGFTKAAFYGSVPIGLAGTQTSSFLPERNIGFSLSGPTVDALVSLFKELDQQNYLQARSNVAALPRESWEWTEKDCRSFVDQLRQLVGSTNKHANLQTGGLNSQAGGYQKQEQLMPQTADKKFFGRAIIVVPCLDEVDFIEDLVNQIGCGGRTSWPEDHRRGWRKH